MVTTIQDLHDRAGNPDLSHWNTAETFSLLEAAFLSAGIDPLEAADMTYLRKNHHPNWKNAALFIRSLKEGVCTGEIVCIDIYMKCYHNDQWGNWDAQKVETFDLTVGNAVDIIEETTIITRKALYDWCKRKGLLRIAPKNKAGKIKPLLDASDSAITEVEFKEAKTLSLPAYLDPSHPLSAAELVAANEAWTAVAQNGDPRASGAAVKTAIRKYLDAHEKHSKLSNEAKNRICTVSNWNKKGGATTTPE